MTRRAVLRRDARADFVATALWYEEQRSGLGDVFRDQVLDLIERIADAPLQFPNVGKAVRRGLVHRFPYAVYFVVEDQAVVILAILHQSRDPEVWRRRA